MPTDQAKLEECFRRALALAPGVPVANLINQNDPVWDSVAHMRLAAEIEMAFDLTLTGDQILDMVNYAKAWEIVSARSHAA